MFLFLHGDLHLQELWGAIISVVDPVSIYKIYNCNSFSVFQPVFTTVFFLHNFQHDLAATVSKWPVSSPPCHAEGLGDELVRWLGRYWARELFVTEGLRGPCLGCESFGWSAGKMEGSPTFFPYDMLVGWCEEMKIWNALYQGMLVNYRYCPKKNGNPMMN